MKVPGLTLEDLERMGATIGPAAKLPSEPIKARGRAKHRSGQMNKTEAAYWDELQLRLAAGEIAWCAFEPMKLRLAPKTFYTPDFGVMLPGGTIEFHETKGFIEDDAAVKFKVVREFYWMFRFRMFQRKKKTWVEIYKEMP